MRWSAKLLELPANADLTVEFNRPFDEPVEVRRGGRTATATGCASAIDLFAQGYEPVTSVDYLYLKNAALTCLIFREIAAGNPAARSFLTGVQMDAALVPLLPAELDIGTPAEADGEDALAAHPAGFEQRLEILARGDFDGDGVEDWLVRSESWATGGASREVRAFVLTRAGRGDTPLRLIKELR